MLFTAAMISFTPHLKNYWLYIFSFNNNSFYIGHVNNDKTSVLLLSARGCISYYHHTTTPHVLIQQKIFMVYYKKKLWFKTEKTFGNNSHPLKRIQYFVDLVAIWDLNIVSHNLSYSLILRFYDVSFILFSVSCK